MPSLARLLLKSQILIYLNYIRQFAEPYGSGFATAWWTGGSDEYHEGRFVWCYPDKDTNIVFSAAIAWQPGQPENTGGNENCILALIQGGTPPKNLLLHDAPCHLGDKRFICEVIHILILIQHCSNAFVYFQRSLFGPAPFPKCPTIDCKIDVRVKIYLKSSCLFVRKFICWLYNIALFVFIIQSSIKLSIHHNQIVVT